MLREGFECLTPVARPYRGAKKKMGSAVCETLRVVGRVDGRVGWRVVVTSCYRTVAQCYIDMEIWRYGDMKTCRRASVHVYMCRYIYIQNDYWSQLRRAESTTPNFEHYTLQSTQWLDRH